MGTFIMAYLAVWLAVVLYLGRLAIRQHRLQRTVDSLTSQLEQKSDSIQPKSKAA